MIYPKTSRNCWLEIDLDNLKSNYNEIQKHVKPKVKVMAVVKANAYGHGIVQCSKVLEECSADILGVGSLKDGIKLRKNNIKLPILIFASNAVEDVANIYAEYNLIPTILTYEQAKAMSDIPSDTPHSIYLKIETGRGRLGINAEEMIDFVKKVKKLSNVSIDGIYSHMADANWSDISGKYSLWQYERFSKFIEELKNSNIEIPFLQLANSGGLIAYPDIQLTGVAPGSALWGYSSLEPREEYPQLKNVLISWKSRLIQVKEVIGGKFGENHAAIKLDKPKRIGVIVGGLSDGIDHRQGTGGMVIIRGKKLSIASGIAIEHSIVDLTDCPEAAIGDEAVILGKQGKEEITLNDLCKHWKRTPLEFLTSLNLDLDRIYIKDNAIYSIDAGEGLKYL
jgi:alanine racemase